jgi:hypothetical protein
MPALVLAGLTMGSLAGTGAEPGDLALSMAQAPGGPPAPAQYLYIPIYAVRTADDDGSNAAYVTASKVQSLVAGVNLIFAAVGIQFTFDSAQDFPPVVNDTLLNQDCTLRRSDLTNQHVEPTCDAVPHAHAREAFAVQHNDHVVIFFRWGTQFQWNAALGSWQAEKATGASSSHCALRVRTTAGGGSAAALAHELGHYFNCLHTFRPEPTTVADAAASIKNYVLNSGVPKNMGLDVFDGDELPDTPPDAGRYVFVEVYGDKCAPSSGIPILVDYYPDLPRSYLLNPDRNNIMSYFFGCPGIKHFSPMQIARIRASLEGGNRSHLIGGQRGAYVTEEYEKTWPTNATIMVSFTMDERPHILAYGPNGAVRMSRVSDDTKDVTTVWSGTWSNQYTSIVPLDLNGAPYLLLYKKTTGYVSVVKVNAGGKGVSGVWTGTWSLYANYTDFVPFVQNGVPHAVMYRKGDGHVHFLKFTGGAPAMIWTGSWDVGYSSVVPFDQDGQRRILLYKKGSGAVTIANVNAGAQGITKVWSDSWSPGYASIAILRRGGVEPHALLYKGVGSAKIVQIQPDGFGVTNVWSDWWSTGYTAIVPFYILHPSLLLYKAGIGAAQILEICM